MAKEYQVIARKYRPQRFQDVVGQKAIVTTLKNAIQRNQLAHAYLFCGSRGTGKTTLARLFAKALNCQQRSEDLEPCNQCTSCREITSGRSMDVLEIDGASHRGIDDIRQINETVGYATASGEYKIYIIDEVHMLTKEAFNALLKTLEEPPPKVKFFFATTEAHKLPPTILSRCQRFNLGRFTPTEIIGKLRTIAQNMNVPIEEEALCMLANRADGGLRDAESLLEQMLVFHDGPITTSAVAAVLGMVLRDRFFALDKAGKEGNLGMAFEIAHQVFSEGKDIGGFLECLAEHYRNLLLVKIAGKDSPFLALSSIDRDQYEAAANLYSREQCLTILDIIIEAQNQRASTYNSVALEALLLRILRTHQRIPIEHLVRRLSELEQSIKQAPSAPIAPAAMPTMNKPVSKPKQEPIKVSAMAQPQPAPLAEAATATAVPKTIPPTTSTTSNTPIDLGAHPTEEARLNAIQQQSRHDTLLQFAAVELEGSLQKHRTPPR